MTTCPSCKAILVDGALRCRSCGSRAAHGPGFALSLESLLSPSDLEALELFEQLERAAPAVASWYRDADDSTGREVERLLAELRQASAKKDMPSK